MSAQPRSWRARYASDLCAPSVEAVHNGVGDELPAKQDCSLPVSQEGKGDYMSDRKIISPSIRVGTNRRAQFAYWIAYAWREAGARKRAVLHRGGPPAFPQVALSFLCR